MPKVMSAKNLADGKDLCDQYVLQKIWARGPPKFLGIKVLLRMSWANLPNPPSPYIPNHLFTGYAFGKKVAELDGKNIMKKQFNKTIDASTAGEES